MPKSSEAHEHEYDQAHKDEKEQKHEQQEQKHEHEELTTMKGEAQVAHKAGKLQLLMQSSPLRCREAFTHSMREDCGAVLNLPHVKLIEEDEDVASPFASPSSSPPKTYEIQVSNLSYMVVASSQPRPILDDINCTARPGELLAIVGPSGAGKSTLLEIVAGRISPTKESSILVNQKPVDRSVFRRISSYVMQHDELCPVLTVMETLMLSANLRLPRKTPASDKRARVKSLIFELGLNAVASSRIGSNTIRGISGGERRRVSIGVDVVHNPAVLFLDEPTSGLDSSSAQQIVELLHDMAKSHSRTIVLSIHQPSFRILERIQSIVVLAKGRLIHYGTLEQLRQRFNAGGHKIPENMNVVEFAMERIDKVHSDNIIAKYFNAAVFIQHSSPEDLFEKTLRQELEEVEFILCNKVATITTSPVTASPVSPPDDDKPSFANPWYQEILLLSARCWKTIVRMRQLFLGRTLQALGAGLALGSIFFNVSGDVDGVKQRNGFFAFTLTFLMTSTSEALPMFLAEREIIMRETSRGAYRISSYVIANTIMYLPFLFVFALLYSIPTYFLLGLHQSPHSYLFFHLVIWLSVIVANSIVAFFSALAPDYIMGNTLISGTLGAFFLFSGFFVPKSKLPKYWSFMHVLSVFKYPMDALQINEYKPEAQHCFNRVTPNICLLSGEDILVSEHLANEDKWINLVYMVCFAIAYRILSYIVLRCKRKHKQE